MKRKLIAAIGVAGMLFSVAACGGDDGDGGKKAGVDGYAGQTLTVWVMDGSSPDQWQKDLTAEFEKKTKAKSRGRDPSLGLPIVSRINFDKPARISPLNERAFFELIRSPNSRVPLRRTRQEGDRRRCAANRERRYRKARGSGQPIRRQALQQYHG